MSERRVVLSERSAGTLNDRFRKIQEDSTKEKQSAVKARKVIRTTIPTRSASLTRPSSRGVTKPNPRGRGRASRGISNSESNGRGGRGRGRGGSVDSKVNGNAKDFKIKSITGTRGRGRGGRGRGRGRGTSDRAGRGGEKKSVNKDDLDNEIESYMLKDADIGKDLLDSELSEYMLQRGTQTTTEEELAVDNQDE